MIPGNANPLLLASAADAAAAGVATKSLRFNDDDSAYLNRTPSSASNRKTWSWSAWVKRSALGTDQKLFSAGTGSNYFALAFNSSDQIQVDSFGTGANAFYMHTGDMVFRDASAWYSVVAVLNTTESTGSDRFKLYINGSQVTLTVGTNVPPSNADQLVNSTIEHKIGNSAYGSTSNYFDGYLADIHFIDGSALDPTSFGAYDDNGVWQAAAYSGTFGTNGFHLKFDDASSNAALGTDSSGNGNTFTVNNLIAAQFSPTATVVGDPTSSTDNPFGSGNGHSVDFDGNDSIRFSGPGLITGDLTVECFLKINSGQSGYQRAFSTNEAVYSSEQTIIRRKNTGAFQFYFGDGNAEETDDTVDANTWHHAAISYDQSASAVSYYVDGTRVGTDTYSGTVSITEMVVAGGMTNENFNGKVSNCRITKQLLYTGTSLTVPTSTLTTTSQGATASNVVMLCCHQSSTTAVEGSFSAASDTDSLFDVPTNGTQSDTGAGGEVSGNYCTLNPLLSGSTHTLSNGNLDVSMSGSSQHTTAGTIGVSSGKWYWEMTVNALSSTYYPGVGIDTNPVGSVQSGSTATGLMYLKSGAKFTSGNLAAYGASYDVGDVIGVALDMDGGTLTFYKNGSSQGQAFSSISGTVFPVVTGTLNGTPGASFNFGQRAWAYSAPSNHKALCTTNLPTPTIADGSDYFETVTWTGTGASKSLTTGFSPDFIWLKNRAISSNHRIFDTVRGQGVMSHTNTSDSDQSDTNNLTSFDSNGFTVGTNSNTNGSGNGIVAWTWDAGSSTVSNTDGSITSQVRASQTSGFSIVTYSVPSSGSTFSVGHGLGAAPSMIIARDRDTANPWGIYHSALGVGKGLLFSTAAEQVNSNWWNNTNPTSTLFYLNTGIYAHSQPGNDYVAFCFAPVAGYSAFGSYTGNGSSSDGPFIHTGFRPSLIILKPSSGTGNWTLFDTTRDTFNVADSRLHANLADAEATSNTIDILSNGFKIYRAGLTENSNGVTYIYAAFAENPFQANGGLAR